jgi:hypothetical protein
VKIHPPVVVNVFDEYKNFKESLKNTTIDMYVLQDRILHSTNPKAYKDMYESKLIDIKNIESDMDVLKRYFAQVNSLNETTLEDQLSETLDKEYRSYERISEDIDTYVNQTEVQNYIKHYNRKYKIAEDISIEGKKPFIDFYIKVLPKKVVNNKLKKNEEIKEDTFDEGYVKKRLSPIQKDKIKNNIKDLIRQKFKFRNKEECLSKAKTKPWFMSKEDLIKVIEENPEIKITLPKNYKSLKKEEICKFLT